MNTEKCDYALERQLVYRQIGLLAFMIGADVCSLYGVGHGPCGGIDHYINEVRKVLSWDAETLIEHAHSWAGRPLELPPSNPRQHTRLQPCKDHP